MVPKGCQFTIPYSLIGTPWKVLVLGCLGNFPTHKLSTSLVPGNRAETAAFAPGPLAAISPKPSLSSLVFKMQKLAPGRFGCQQQETWDYRGQRGSR